jgi:hypothetical protein
MRESGREVRMPGIMLLRGALQAFSTMLGSLGIFFLYLSFLRPALAAYALVFLGAASAIVWSLP